VKEEEEKFHRFHPFFAISPQFFHVEQKKGIRQNLPCLPLMRGYFCFLSIPIRKLISWKILGGLFMHSCRKTFPTDFKILFKVDENYYRKISEGLFREFYAFHSA
jgi:hypothetical protein